MYIPSTHQSQGKGEETQAVHDEYELQSKNVKLVLTRLGPSATLTANWDVKWLSPVGITGNKSFLNKSFYLTLSLDVMSTFLFFNTVAIKELAR